LVREAIKAYDCDPNVFENEDFRERAMAALSAVVPLHEVAFTAFKLGRESATEPDVLSELVAAADEIRVDKRSDEAAQTRFCDALDAAKAALRSSPEPTAEPPVTMGALKAVNAVLDDVAGERDAAERALQSCMFLAGKRLRAKSPDAEFWNQVVTFCDQGGVTSIMRDAENRTAEP
jgi:hypothetical protein